MQSKDSIRRQILNYGKIIWGTKKIDQADIIVRLLVEELTNELYYMQNSIDNIEKTLLEKLAIKLTPPEYIPIRPAHGIFQSNTALPKYLLSRQIPFYLTEKPENLQEKEIENVVFHPITDVRLFNIRMEYICNIPNLYLINSVGEKEIKSSTRNRELKSNSIWLGLEIDSQIDNIKGLSFYIDFPELSEIHDYYEVIQYTELILNGKHYHLDQGFLSDIDFQSDTHEYNVLSFYNRNYLTISDDILVQDLHKENFPSRIASLFNPEDLTDMKPKYWVELKFHYYIQPLDMNQIIVALNTFPVSNKQLSIQKVNKEYLKDSVYLLADKCEKLQEITSVTDSNNTIYTPCTTIGDEISGTYYFKPTDRLHIQNMEIQDYIEEITDLIDSEKTAFPRIDIEKINEAIHTISSLKLGTENKIDSNEKNRQKVEIDRLLIYPVENSEYVNIQYWTSFGEIMNNIPSGKKYVPQLEGMTGLSDATGLSTICGGKDFGDVEDLLIINKYLLTSSDRLITEDNISTFCEMELGKAIEKVEIELKGKISPRPKEGMIRTIEIRLYPSDRYPELIYQKGILRNLLTRMKQRSPFDYDYTITVINKF